VACGVGVTESVARKMQRSRDKAAVKRAPNGTLLPGTGGIGGPSKATGEALSFFRAHCVSAAHVLIQLLDHKEPKIRLEAAREILDRGLGRATAAADTPEGTANTALAALLTRYAATAPPPARQLATVEILDPEGE